MTDSAYKVWEAFKAELIVEPTDDMREALATAIRAVAEEIYHDPDVHFLYKLADEMDTLETDH
jgi:formyltetrahydrofolate synthetase